MTSFFDPVDLSELTQLTGHLVRPITSLPFREAVSAWVAESWVAESVGVEHGRSLGYFKRLWWQKWLIVYSRGLCHFCYLQELGRKKTKPRPNKDSVLWASPSYLDMTDMTCSCRKTWKPHSVTWSIIQNLQTKRHHYTILLDHLFPIDSPHLPF